MEMFFDDRDTLRANLSKLSDSDRQWAEPRGSGWYIADQHGRDVLGITFLSKRAAIKIIRLMSR